MHGKAAQRPTMDLKPRITRVLCSKISVMQYELRSSMAVSPAAPAAGVAFAGRTMGAGAGWPLLRTSSLYLLELTLVVYAFLLMNLRRVSGS